MLYELCSNSFPQETPPSSALPTLTCLRSPYFPAKLCLRLSPAYFCMLALLNLLELEMVPASWLFPQFVQYTSQGIQRKAVYPDIQKSVFREHEIIGLISCFITDCKAAQSCYSYRRCMLYKISKNITQVSLKSLKDGEFVTSSGGLF